jgi:hypothetical protein
MALKREAENRERRMRQAAPGDTLQGCPTLVEYLTATTWDDGQERPTATLLLFTEDGVWKCCLNDRANSRSAWVSGDTPEGCITALEEGLSLGDLPWRRSKGFNKQSN